jgi:thiamine biosynthesis lipoprotein ApbE
VAAAHKAKKQKRTVLVASKTMTIADGSTTTVTLTVNATGRKLLKRFHKLPVTLTIKQTDNGHATIAVTHAITIK